MYMFTPVSCVNNFRLIIIFCHNDSHFWRKLFPCGHNWDPIGVLNSWVVCTKQVSVFEVCPCFKPGCRSALKGFTVHVYVTEKNAIINYG